MSLALSLSLSHSWAVAPECPGIPLLLSLLFFSPPLSPLHKNTQDGLPHGQTTRLNDQKMLTGRDIAHAHERPRFCRDSDLLRGRNRDKIGVNDALHLQFGSEAKLRFMCARACTCLRLHVCASACVHEIVENDIVACTVCESTCTCCP